MLLHMSQEGLLRHILAPLEIQQLHTKETGEASPQSWQLFVDGSSTSTRSGDDLILTSPDKFKVMKAIRFPFKATNNQVEYEALIAAINLAKSLQVRNISIFSDSKIVVWLTSRDYATKDLNLAKYQAIVKSLLSSFQELHTGID